MRVIKCGLFIILIVLLSFAVSGRASAQVGQIWETIIGNPDVQDTDPNPDTDGDNKDFGPAPTCGDVVARLKSDFGVTVKEGGLAQGGWGIYPPENVGCNTRQGIYNALATPSKSAGFRQRLKKYNEWTIECYQHTDPLRTAGYTPDGYHIQIRNCGFVNSYYRLFAFHILHEVGHLIKDRNYRDLYQGFPVASLASADPTCYDGLFIKTYSLREPQKPRSESMAEATAFNVYNSKTNITLGTTISDFKNQCNNTYAWTKANVYGGYEF